MANASRGEIALSVSDEPYGLSADARSGAANALRWAQKSGVGADQLETFLQDQGINACDEKYRAWKRDFATQKKRRERTHLFAKRSD